VIFAARSGNITSLRERVSAGGDVNHVDPSHGAPLMAAIRAGKLEAVQWLLDNGADVNAEYGDQEGPLEVALYYPKPEMVGLLLRAGARLKRKTRPYYAARLEECLKVLGRAQVETGAPRPTRGTSSSTSPARHAILAACRKRSSCRGKSS
jgi:hypothetical protein